MYYLRSLLILSICLQFTARLFSKDIKNTTAAAETLSVTYYDNLTSALLSGVSVKLNPARTEKQNYTSFFAKNNESISIKKKTGATDYSILATGAFENSSASNATPLNGPSDKGAVYELLSGISKKNTPDKVYFTEIAFIDSSTAVTIAYSKKNATLLLIDISSNPMRVNSAINVPVVTALLTTQKDIFSVNKSTGQILIPVQKMTESISKEGILVWKKKKNALPGIWIITPVKNDEKKWVADRSSISVRYFENNALKSNLQIQNTHIDNSGNIWFNFNKGICGVLPITVLNKTITYADQVILYNFNKDLSRFSDMQRNYKELLYQNLKNTIDTETQDTVNFQKQVYKHPDAFANQYLSASRYNTYSKILRSKEALLDSNKVYENPEALWQYVSLQLDPPNTKKQNKLTDYFGFKLKSFQTLHNGITSADDNSVFVSTNTGIHKLSYNVKNNAVETKWYVPYENSYLKTDAQKAAASATTPTYIADKEEVVFCDNAFPQINLLILDAKTGNLKFKFPLFEYNIGSACENAIAYTENIIIAGNTFGNSNSLKSDALAYPANGIMKFNCSTSGKWSVDYNWNKNQVNTPTNTAAPKISIPDHKAYIYHNNSGQWQLSVIRLDKTDTGFPLLFSLTPDFKNIGKTNIGNFKSNFTFGPNKSILIGTKNGLLRMVTE